MFSSLIHPKSLAVVGASANKKKLGAVVYNNIRLSGFRGKVYPVNISGGKINGDRVFTSVADIPGRVDCAVIVIPAEHIPSVIVACGKKRIPFAIVISAGFGELDEAGKLRELELQKLAKKYHVRLLGPNCLGIISPYIKLNASFAQGIPEPGSVAVISQSGAMAVAITDWALNMDIGFSALVSLGNKSDIEEDELLRYFAHDPKTRVIVMYLESIKKGRVFLQTLSRVTKKKPVVILKPGKSTQAQAAVMSHTGSLAGSYEVQQASLQATGAIVVDSLQHLFLFTQMFERPRKILGKRVAILTNAGGPAILATDELVAHDFTLSKLVAKTVVELKKFLPQAASIHNPIDVVGDAPSARYLRALQLVAKDPGVDAVIAIMTHQYVTESELIAKGIIRISRKIRKPIFVSCIGGKAVENARALLLTRDIPEFPYPELAVKALAALWHSQNASRMSFTPTHVALTAQTSSPVLGTAAENIVKKYIPYVLPSRISSSVAHSLRDGKKVGYPVVAKVISSEFLHKTDKGFVVVNIPDEKSLKKVVTQWQKKITKPFAKGEGFSVQAYVPGMVELFIGAKRDPQLGAYIIFGLGGIFVNQIRETVVHPLPISLSQAKKILQQDRIGAMYTSDRGRKLPWADVARCLSGISDLFMQNPHILECDFNPVIVTKDRVVLPDIRLIVGK